MTGLARTCQVDFLNLETNVEPLKERYRKNDEILFDKCARLPRCDGRRQLIEKEVIPRLKTRHGFRHTTKGRMDMNIKRDTITPPIAPWKTMTQLEVQYVELTKKNSEYRPEQLKQTTLEKIYSIKATLSIYTDGSTNGNQENGGVGVTIRGSNSNLTEESSHSAGALCSSYTGECVAFLEAIK